MPADRYAQTCRGALPQREPRSDQIIRCVRKEEEVVQDEIFYREYNQGRHEHKLTAIHLSTIAGTNTATHVDVTSDFTHPTTQTNRQTINSDI